MLVIYNDVSHYIMMLVTVSPLDSTHFFRGFRFDGPSQVGVARLAASMSKAWQFDQWDSTC